MGDTNVNGLTTQGSSDEAQDWRHKNEFSRDTARQLLAEVPLGHPTPAISLPLTLL
jgi:hypothetical protein